MLSGKQGYMMRGGAVRRLGTMVRKKVCKRVAQSFPLNGVRIWALRCAGYHVGEQVYIGEGFFVLDELEKTASALSIGDRAAIAPRVLVVLNSYPNNSRLRDELGDVCGDVTIGADAWIGACAVLLPNVTVGEQAVVATSAVVREDVAPRTVVGGIPAHFIKSLDPVPAKLLKRRTN